MGFDSFYAFQNRYAIIQKRSMGSHNFQHIVGYRNLEELTRKIDDFDQEFSRIALIYQIKSTPSETSQTYNSTKV